MMKRFFIISTLILVLIASSLLAYSYRKFGNQRTSLRSALNQEPPEKALPLLRYTFDALEQRNYTASQIKIERILDEQPEFTSYLFSYTTLNKKVTGQLNIPTDPALKNNKVIVMLRGYVAPEIYETGMGTRNAAAVYARNGYITIAPDFLGYGESDPEPPDTWQARFEKPIIVIELLKSIEEFGVPLAIDSSETLKTTDYALWGHSNGGQIALSTLTILHRSIPTTLWAPVTAPFPYSILFFTDENIDEGKDARKWLSLFEQYYDVFDFTFTQHLDDLQGPIQIHHGTADEAALYSWTLEFNDKVIAENNRREELNEQIEEASASAATNKLSVTPITIQIYEPIQLDLFTYPDADHNLQPGWDSVVERDLKFFAENL